MKGDTLASGAAKAVFLGPQLKFNQDELKQDFDRLPAEAFILKYLITQREYDLMVASKGEEVVNIFAEQMKRQAEFYERGMGSDRAQADSLSRECFLTPCVLPGWTGRVIVDRDEPATPKGERGKLLIPRAMRTQKVLLPTTGHIIKAVVFDPGGKDVSVELVGRRVLFNQMSGSPICFNGYPTWTQLELTEILCWVDKEDTQVIEEELAPMV